MTPPLARAVTQRVLLLIPTTSYRTQAFLDAARRLGVEITVASERVNILAQKNPGGLLRLDFHDHDQAARTVRDFSRQYSLSAIVGVDDETTVLAATLSAALGLTSNSIEATVAARNKFLMRERLSVDGVSQPKYALSSTSDDPKALADKIEFPCVVKPVMLAGSRGVIRANNEDEFLSAFGRLKKLLETPEIACEKEANEILVEKYIPGKEVSVEGILTSGRLSLLTIFDKPNPLEGPFFEETIYVTPTRLPARVQEQISLCVHRATRALGLHHGPIHAELRINEEGPWVIEIAARSIGGMCSRALRFISPGAHETISLEVLILRHVLGVNVESFQRELQSSGVMMIPIPVSGILNEVRGVQEAKAVPFIEDVIISMYVGSHLVTLPEGSKYLGFIFARASFPDQVESALREAHRRLQFVISSPQEESSAIDNLDKKFYY